MPSSATSATIPFLDLRAAYGELRAEIDAAGERVLASGRYLLGEEIEAFEAEFATYCGARHCIGVGNGLDALALILRALDIGAGDEVLVPGNTFIATWLAVSQVGAIPVPVEPEAGSFNLDPARVEAAITSRSRAVIAVHLYGRPAEMTALREIADRRGLALIEDAAQAHGARWRGRRAGSLGAAAAFSFYPGKNLGALADAGAVVTDQDQLAGRVRRLRNYGSVVKYVHDEQGVNSRLSELQAAFLRVKLRHLEDWNGRRRRVAAAYLAALRDLPDLVVPSVAEECESVWHLFVVRSRRRDPLRRALAARGVETLVHYPIPPHRSGAYRDMANLSLPISEALASEVLSLPIGPHLTDAQTEWVARAVRDALAE